jgi:antitoxin component YwqK of YwqJK toxin-antitoxin module
MSLRRTILLTSALCTLSIPLTAGEVMDSKSNDLTRQGQIWLFKGEPFTGEVRRIEDDGVITILPLQAGYVTGVVRGKAPDGTLRREGAFKKSMPVGLHRTWWPDGKKQSENNYLEGIPEGESRTWYANGNPYEVHRYKRGQEYGAQQVWFEDKRLKANYEIRNGRRYGNFGAMGCIGGDKPKAPKFDEIKQRVIE